MRAVAIVCARNEAIHIERCLRDFIDDGIEVLLIDHESTDDTRAIARPFLGAGLIGIETMQWRGFFSLIDQLEFKKQVMSALPHDWVIHADADEWLQVPGPRKSLLTAMTEADVAGCNCINFHEFAFVAYPGEDFAVPNYSSLMRTYYFFQRGYPRLMRAWKRAANLDNSKLAGHILQGDEVRVYPTEFYLRHYIMLSEAHVQKKYLARRYSEADVAAEYHGDRLNLEAARLRLRQNPALRSLPEPSSNEFDMSEPAVAHFWDWP